jgi:hypothetical protein
MMSTLPPSGSPSMIRRHIVFEEEDLSALRDRFGPTITVSLAVRLLVKEYIREPSKFELSRYEVKR